MYGGVFLNFVFDLDGTLCFDGQTIAPAIQNALHKLSAQENEIIFASARPIRDMISLIPSEFKRGKLVGGNGCFTYDDGDITTTYLEPDLIASLKAIILKHNLTYLADGEWDFSFTGSQEHQIYKNIDQTTAKNIAFNELEKVCKLVLFNPTTAVLDELAGLPILVTAYKNENAIDVSPLGINKVAGLRQLNITEFIAFGNDSNDQCLFDNAIQSICIGEHTVKKHASFSIDKSSVPATILDFVNTTTLKR